jgi:hypothetical protein
MRSRRICSIPFIFLLALGVNERNLAVADRSAGAAAASSALNVLKKLDYRYFVAGGTCAALSHGITTPVDVVRAVEYASWPRHRMDSRFAPEPSQGGDNSLHVGGRSSHVDQPTV